MLLSANSFQNLTNEGMDVYAYCLSFDANDPFHFSSGGTRRFNPCKCKAFSSKGTKEKNNFNDLRWIYVRSYGKTGILLSKKTNANIMGKPDLKIFSTKESMLSAFKHDYKNWLKAIDARKLREEEIKTEVAQSLLPFENGEID